MKTFGGIVAFGFGYNIYRFTCVYRSHNAPRSVIEMQDSVLKAKRHPHTEPLPRRGNTVTTVR